MLVALLALSLNADEWISGIPWPEPAVVDPGPVGGPPSDAIVLFDGKDLSQWNNADKWKVQDGYAVSNGNDIRNQAGVRRLPVARGMGHAGKGRGRADRDAAIAASS